jgi:hypothetical protein
MLLWVRRLARGGRFGLMDDAQRMRVRRRIARARGRGERRVCEPVPASRTIRRRSAPIGFGSGGPASGAKLVVGGIGPSCGDRVAHVAELACAAAEADFTRFARS